jgi:hypothetical protein
MSDPVHAVPDRRAAARALLLLAGAVHGTALAVALSGSEVGAAWFYDLAWWPYIVAVDAIVYLRRGRSLLLTRPRTFVLLTIWSAALWLAFEVVNFRLQNWYYVGIPRDWIARGPGVFLSFATVLPGIFETFELLACFRVAEGTRSRPFALHPRLLRALSITGVAFLVLPLLFPRHAYPLIWGALVLLAEPWLAARGERSLLHLLARGEPAAIVRLLLAGAVCGFLWESWNYLALARWIYTVPFFEDSKLFEMPYLGFVGFPPFALECFTFARLLVALRLLPEWELDQPERAPSVVARERAGAVCALALSVPAIVAVNVWTLRATAPRVAEIPDVPAQVAARLEAAGIESGARFLERAADGSLAPLLEGVEGVDPMRIEGWTRAAALMQVKGMGARGLSWLALAGIDSVDELARADPIELARSLASKPRGIEPPPTLAELRVWIAGARARGS